MLRVTRKVGVLMLATMASFGSEVGAVSAQVTGTKAVDRHEELQRQLNELQRQLDIVTEEIRTMKEESIVPEEAPVATANGLAPAASKVYAKKRGVSIGGYGEYNYKDSLSTSDDTYDFLRLVLYLGYKFTDRIVFNSEIEFEHASTGSNDENGEVSVEQAYLDFLLAKQAHVRAGLVLVPMGFLNQLHEPPFYHGNQRPSVEREIIPTTWRANGIGFYGEITPGLRYQTYAVTSLRAARFSSANLRGGRQDGNQEQAQDFSWAGRLDYTLTPGLDLGASIYLGNQGQGDELTVGAETEEVNAFMGMYEGHVQWHVRGLEFRALGVFVHLDNASALSANAGETIGKEMWGAYGELAYNVLPHIFPASDQYLAPWFRYSRYNTQAEVPSGFVADDAEDREDIEIGLSYKPIPQVVVKSEYRYLEAEEGSRPDEYRLGAGFEF